MDTIVICYVGLLVATACAATAFALSGCRRFQKVVRCPECCGPLHYAWSGEPPERVMACDFCEMAWPIFIHVQTTAEPIARAPRRDAN